MWQTHIHGPSLVSESHQGICILNKCPFLSCRTVWVFNVMETSIIYLRHSEFTRANSKWIAKIVGRISGRAKRQISWIPSQSPFQYCLLCSHTACVCRQVCMCICTFTHMCMSVCTYMYMCVRVFVFLLPDFSSKAHSHTPVIRDCINNHTPPSDMLFEAASRGLPVMPLTPAGTPKRKLPSTRTLTVNQTECFWLQIA